MCCCMVCSRGCALFTGSTTARVGMSLLHVLIWLRLSSFPLDSYLGRLFKWSPVIFGAYYWNMRMPGVKPGSQAWEACMMPLHYMRLVHNFMDRSPLAYEAQRDSLPFISGWLRILLSQTWGNRGVRISALDFASHRIYKRSWCCGTTPASHEEGPGFNPPCVHFFRLRNNVWAHHYFKKI